MASQTLLGLMAEARKALSRGRPNPAHLYRHTPLNSRPERRAALEREEQKAFELIFKILSEYRDEVSVHKDGDKVVLVAKVKISRRRLSVSRPDPREWDLTDGLKTRLEEGFDEGYSKPERLRICRDVRITVPVDLYRRALKKISDGRHGATDAVRRRKEREAEKIRDFLAFHRQDVVVSPHPEHRGLVILTSSNGSGTAGLVAPQGLFFEVRKAIEAETAIALPEEDGPDQLEIQ